MLPILITLEGKIMHSHSRDAVSCNSSGAAVKILSDTISTNVLVINGAHFPTDQ
jgi:hypothetical protein